jgi:hypothetical protein
MRRTTMRHARTIVGIGLFGSLALVWTESASAQERRPSYLNESLPAPSNTFELKLGTGYTQGFGNVAPNQSILSVGGAGIGVGIDADWRATPQASIGLESQYQEFTTQNNSATRGLAFNVGATYHTTPEKRGDFWLRLGTGYRMLWDVHPGGNPNINNMYHGFDIATLKVGYDVRTSADAAIAPVIGADLQTFTWQNADRLSTTQVGTFIYAGIQGRVEATPPPRGPVVAHR